MPENPYDEDELKRQAQIGMLSGQPTSNTMPVGGATQAFEGFDFNRPQDIKKSAKDAFAHYSKLAPAAPINDKGALGQWFQQYVRPGFEGEGHQVSSVDGDKFTYGNHEGTFAVDYGRGAGADGGALAWQAEPGDEATRQRYGTPAASAPAAPSGGGINPAADSSALARIMAELQATKNDDPSPAEREALLAMLQGGI